MFIETPRGRVKQRTKLTYRIDPRMIAADHRRWFPEVKTPGHAWDPNINILTDNDTSGYDAAMGATNLSVLLCNIYKVDDG